MIVIRHHAYGAIAFLCILALSYTLFHPGLTGGLIFDDIPNLYPLKGIGDANSLENVIRFSASANYFPGRPLSLLSFLINDQSWPLDTWSLKHTSLMLHLLNTSLVLWLLMLLLPRLLPTATPSTIVATAIGITLVWSIHPLQTSTVSYIIQRMNLLSTLSILAGLIFFIHARERFQQTPFKSLLILTGTIASLALGVLFKENGLLLCGFCLLISQSCFPPITQQRFLWNLTKTLVFVLPIAAFIFYVLVDTAFFTKGYEHRNFNALERLLTQGPVLVDYIKNILFPRLSGTGLFFDDYPVSRGLFQPPATFIAWLALIAWAGVAMKWRHKQPLFAFGTAFFFIGHSMESSVLSLELYFEHRNYLPQLGIWMCVADIGIAAFRHIQAKSITPLLGLATGAIVLTFSTITYANATLWGNDILLAETWRNERNTPRAQLRFAGLAYDNGQMNLARNTLKETAAQHPDMIGAQLSLAFIECTEFNTPFPVRHLLGISQRATFDNASLEILEKLRDPVVMTSCKGLSPDDLLSLYQALDTNPHFQAKHTQATLHAAMADQAVRRHDLSGMMYHYDQAFSAKHNAVYPYRQAVYLATAGLYTDAKQYLEKAERALTLQTRLYLPDLPPRIAGLRSAISHHLESQQSRHNDNDTALDHPTGQK